METVKDLIRDSVGLLRSNSLTSINFSKPHYPACVIYFGNRSAQFHGGLLENLLRGWGGGAEYIKFYTIENTENKKITDVSGGELSETDVKTQITEMLAAQNVFSDMTRVALYCVIDTTEVTAPEIFKDWYCLINYLEGLIGVSTLSMLTVVLNESLQLTESAQGIKNRILDMYHDETLGGINSHLYDSVFIIGNRLKNGSFIKIFPSESDYANFNLFADLILLSNTRGEDYNTRRSRLYGNEKPAMTAAYGMVQKPMAEIVMIILGIILEKLKELAANQSVSQELLMEALGIDKGRAEVYENFYSDIKALIPGNEFMNWLPGKNAPDKSFEEYNRATDGGLQAFLEQNHFDVVKTELLNRNEITVRDIAGRFSNVLNAAQLINGVPVTVRDTVYDKAEIAVGSPDRLQVQAAIQAKVKLQITKGLRQKTDAALNEAIDKAKKTMDDFSRICSEHERMFAIGEEGTRKNLAAFYGERIRRYFNDTSKLNELFAAVLKIGNNRDSILKILINAIEAFFGSDPVYKLSFSEEFMTRLGNIDTEKRAQEFIGQELIQNLDDKIGFYSKYIFHGRTFEAYMLNTEGTNNNLLYWYLKDKEIPPEIARTFFNTCNNDMAESIWFYVCSEDNLRL